MFGIGCFSQPVPSETLSDDILLNVFRHYLDATPRNWPTLAWVCHRWRQTVLTSPLGLNLRLHFTHGMPVVEALHCWTALPILVLYGGTPNLKAPVPEDDDNIIAALKQSGRVSSISLTVTSSLIKKLSTISEPFSELEDLALLSQDMQLTLPPTFRWGPHLHTLHSTRIAFPSLPPLLSPCQDLVDLQLCEIPRAGYFFPEAFANVLAGTPQLRSLTLHFLSLPSRRSYLGLPPPSDEHVVLPALTHLIYRGTSKYLDSFVARIDAPHLVDIEITLFSQPTMDTSQLGRFIARVEMQTSLSQAEVKTSEDAISIFFSDSNTSTPLRLQISSKQLDWQLSCMAQVCDQFSPFLFRVEELRVNTTRLSSGPDDEAGEQWLDLVRPFGRARDFQMGNKLSTDILRGLGRADGTVLPALGHLIVEHPREIDEPSWDALLSFINSRLLSGPPIQVNVPLPQCHICHASFRQEKGLKLHLVDKHSYRMICAYCANFVWTLEHNDLFRNHLEFEHPFAYQIALISNSHFFPGSPPSIIESLFLQHVTLHTPDFVAPLPHKLPLPRPALPVQVNVPLPQCHICHASFGQEKGLKLHLVDKHSYRMICAYCSNFVWTPEHNDLFRNHLEFEHPLVAHQNAIISNSHLFPRFPPSMIESLFLQHVTLHTPDTVALSTTQATTATALHSP
jgi:hypothetical protein